MDSRLKFLHHLQLFDDAVTQKDRTSAVMVNRVGSERPWSSEVHSTAAYATVSPRTQRSPTPHPKMQPKLRCIS